MLKPLKRQRLHESISEEVLKYIMDNGLSQGDRLPPERFFCEQFQISRASFREAMKKLEGYGMIEIKPGSGMFLRAEKTILGEIADLKLRVSLEKRSLLEMLDLREMMEQYAIEQIVNQGQSACLETLEAIISEYDRKRNQGEIPRQEDYLFHKTLYEGANNRLLLKLFQSIEDLENLWAVHVIDSVNVSIFGRETEPLHRQILDAMKSGDVKSAKRLMRKHFEILRADLYRLDEKLFQ
ncbi:FadR/GntR family transcriptional regulator [Cohnella sp. JJ-181]|uniref:FadR/GntR family transcriptional regulator n=1 Tax=Cohnella rhizoplanae TaxID=2974897 RepID=UPI0022FFB21F|nr:FadR/GntR family transcriptional regulator [Cohnella sp. JJ-181]CAI6086736.1 Putative L-lactate dehydrogenase operon regulatory protein [Cohnella sp. JJ-181]